jgi:hypothetical protein
VAFGHLPVSLARLCGASRKALGGGGGGNLDSRKSKKPGKKGNASARRARPRRSRGADRGASVRPKKEFQVRKLRAVGASCERKRAVSQEHDKGKVNRGKISTIIKSEFWKKAFAGKMSEE